MTTPLPTILILEGLSGAGARVRAAGGDVLSVSPLVREAVYARLRKRDFDGLLLTGGGDVNPRRYGKKPHAKVYGVNDTRDDTEIAALEVARDMSIPVLGICRGAQIMAVESGGTLRQHIGGHYGMHPCNVVPGTTLARATGGEMRPLVRSLHHQEVLHTAPGWRVSGVAPDGTCEAVETDDGRCLGVQFHPEMQGSEAFARAIFRWLVVEAGERAGIAMPRFAPRAPVVALPSSKGARRKAARARVNPGAAVQLSFFCTMCGVRFDERQDQIDHMIVLHNITPVGAE